MRADYGFSKRNNLLSSISLFTDGSEIREMKKKQNLSIKRLLQIIEFGAIDKMTAEFVRSILSAVLVRSTKQALMDMFQNVISSPQHKFFAEGLQVFIHMAFKKSQKNIDNKLLLSKINFIDSIWGSNPF